MAAKDEEETDIESEFEVTDTHNANISDIPIKPGREQLAQSEDDGEIKKEEVCGHQIEGLTEMAGHVVANEEADRKEKTDFQSFLKEGERQKLLMKTDFEGMQDVARITERESEFDITDTHDVNISDNLTKFWQSEDDGKIEEERPTEITGNVASVIEEGWKEIYFGQRFHERGVRRKPLMKANATYKENKNVLKRYLISNYIATFQPDTLPEDDRLYVEPRMELVTDCFGDTFDVDIFRENTDTDSVDGEYGMELMDGDIKINDVFFKGHKKFYRICISGKAGQGKTALCKMLCLAWCQVHSSKTISEHIPDDFKNVMEKFDILFFIALNDYKIDFNGIEVIRKLYFEDQWFFDLFMKNECDNSSILVILDGNDYPGFYKSFGLPQFPDLSNFRGFSTLITTRPHKLFAMTMWPRETDRKIKLTIKRASDRYIKNMVDILNQKKNDTKNSVLFKQKLKDNHLQHFLNIPIILKQLIILWHHDENEITGRSHVHLYSAMINRLLPDAVDINKKKSLLGRSSQEKDLPVCLKEKQYCNIQKDLLLSLSHFAFTNMFNADPFFQISIADYIQVCLTAGLLCLDDNGQVSFLHKSFQDFLAAVYLVMNRQAEHSLLSFRTTQDILNMRSLFIFACGMDSNILSLLYSLLERNKEKKTCRLLEPTQDLICECIKASENEIHSQLSCHLKDVIIVSEWKDTDWRWDYLSQLIFEHPNSIKTLHVYNDKNISEKFQVCLTRVLKECRSISHVRLVLWEKLPHDVEAVLTKAFQCFWSSPTLKVFGEVPNGLIPYIDDESDDQDETMIDQLQRNGKPFP